MRNPTSRAYSAVESVPGPQEPVNLDFIPYGTTTLAVVVVDGEADYSVEFTLDDVNDLDVMPRWLTFDEFPAESAATKYSVFHGPLAFVRLNLGAITGHVEFKVAQSATPRS